MACHLHPILCTWDVVITCTPVTVFFPLGVWLCSDKKKSTNWGYFMWRHTMNWWKFESSNLNSVVNIQQNACTYFKVVQYSLSTTGNAQWCCIVHFSLDLVALAENMYIEHWLWNSCLDTLHDADPQHFNLRIPNLGMGNSTVKHGNTGMEMEMGRNA